MISILTVCGNGIGSSLMLKMKIEEICAENNIEAHCYCKGISRTI